MISRRLLSVRLGMLAAATAWGPMRMAPANADDDPWPQIAAAAFGKRPLADGAGVLAIEMPARAEDAAVVPVTLRTTLPKGDTRTLRSLTLIIDDNPSPVAATFKVGGSVTMI